MDTYFNENHKYYIIFDSIKSVYKIVNYDIYIYE